MSEGAPNTIDCQTERPGEYPQVLRVRAHTLHADVGPDSGSTDSAPGAHDYFDAALAAFTYEQLITSDSERDRLGHALTPFTPSRRAPAVARGRRSRWP